MALLAVITPYELAAKLVWLLLGVRVSAMGVWRVAQRSGEAAAGYTEELSRYHNDRHRAGEPATPLSQAAAAVVVGVDGCTLGM